MSSNKRVIRNSFIYTTSNILLKACSFLLIPIYTNYLTTDDYGIVSIINSFTSVAIYLIVFSLFSAVFRFYADIKNDHCKVKRYIGTICTFCLITNVFFLAICFCTQKIVSNTFFAGVDFFPIVLLALIYTSTNSLYTLYQDILKSMQFAKKSAVTSLLYFFVQLVICIYLVAILRLGAVGTITAYVVTQIVFCVWAFVDLNKMDVFQFCIDKELLKESLMYSIPIIPHNLSTTIAQYVSKLFISGSFSLSAVGVFNLAQQFGLIALIHKIDGLLDGLHRGGHRIHRHPGRVVQQGVDQSGDLWGHGGREEHSLLFGGQPLQDLFHVVDKAHVQHPVGLVQHHRLHLVQPDGAPLHMVHQAPWGGHHDLGGLFQLEDLFVDGLPAVETHGAHPLLERAQVPQLVPDLDGQLPGGGQHQAGDLGPLGIGVLDHRDAEGKGLARAGGGLGNDILPLHEIGDRPRLDGGGLDIALLFNGPHDGLGQPQLRVGFGPVHLLAVDFHSGTNILSFRFA
mgnify:CR=1 FL=1